MMRPTQSQPTKNGRNIVVKGVRRDPIDLHRLAMALIELGKEELARRKAEEQATKPKKAA